MPGRKKVSRLESNVSRRDSGNRPSRVTLDSRLQTPDPRHFFTPPPFPM